MAYQSVFKRYELKYLLTQAQKKVLLAAMEPHMKLDDYGRTTIRNIYYDTPNYRLVRQSLERPVYKEKLRIRSYCQADPFSPVYVELKKKYDGVVYKRRIALPEQDAMEWISGSFPCLREEQIVREIDYFKDFYEHLEPKVFLSYEREAYYALDGSDFRVTFDESILCRQRNLSLCDGVWGTPLLRNDQTLRAQRKLTYMETSTGLSEDKKYIVRLGKEKIAAFTLVDHNHSDSKTEIPDWQLGAIEFYFAREESYQIQKLDGHTVYVNNVPLDDSSTIRTSTTYAEKYLPEGITGVRVCTQEISGLVAIPSVRIVDGSGNEMAVHYDAASRTFIEQTTDSTINDTERNLAISAVKTYALYMINQASEADIAKYFLRGSDAYKSITDTERGFVQDAASRDFANEAVTDYCRYSDNLFSVRVAVTLNQHRASGSVKESIIDQSLFFEKQPSGNWLCYAMTAVDVSKPVEQIRLTFQDGDTTLESDFYDADSTQIICPVVSVPEGKVFSGWMIEETDESGNPVMNLVFQPDETGKVTLSAGTTLEPMTLTPLFE